MGAPVIYNPADFIDEICEWIAEGRTLREYCRQTGKPSWQTVYGWKNSDKAIADRIAQARANGEEAILEECQVIADNGHNDWEETEFGPRVNPEVVNRSKLRIWTRLELVKKWNPAKYSEKRQLEHSGRMTLEQLVCGDSDDEPQEST